MNLSKKHSKKILTCVLIHWDDALFQFAYKPSRFEACFFLNLWVYSSQTLRQQCSNECITRYVMFSVFQHHQVLIAAGACSV